MTPSAILLSICVPLFLALSGTFVAYFIRQSFSRKVNVAMKVSKRAKTKEKAIRLQPTLLSESQQQYPLAKVK